MEPGADGSAPRTITGAELAPIFVWLHEECHRIWGNLLGEGGDVPDQLMRLSDLLANLSTAETSSPDGSDLYGLAQAMRSLVRRISVHTPWHASVTIASPGEVAS